MSLISCMYTICQVSHFLHLAHEKQADTASVIIPYKYLTRYLLLAHEQQRIKDKLPNMQMWYNHRATVRLLFCQRTLNVAINFCSICIKITLSCILTNCFTLHNNLLQSPEELQEVPYSNKSLTFYFKMFKSYKTIYNTMPFIV